MVNDTYGQPRTLDTLAKKLPTKGETAVKWVLIIALAAAAFFGIKAWVSNENQPKNPATKADSTTMKDTNVVKPDTIPQEFQKSDKRFPKRIDPVKSRSTNQRAEGRHRNDLRKLKF